MRENGGSERLRADLPRRNVLETGPSYKGWRQEVQSMTAPSLEQARGSHAASTYRRRV